MEMKIKCNVCGKNLATIDKDEITVDDQNLYKQMISCQDDGQSDLQIDISE